MSRINPSLFRGSLRRSVLLISTAVLCVFIASCDGFFVSESAIQSVTARPLTVLLKTGDTPPDSYPLTSSATTVGGSSSDDTKNATWASADSTVVDFPVPTGQEPALVTAVGSGKTKVTAKDGGVTSNAINVMTYSVPTPSGSSALFITAPAGFNTAGAAPGTYQFHAFLGSDITFPDVTQFVDWSSDTTNAATVDANGLVTVLSIATPVTVKITATANVGGPGATTAPTPAPSGTLSFTAD